MKIFGHLWIIFWYHHWQSFLCVRNTMICIYTVDTSFWSNYLVNKFYTERLRQRVNIAHYIVNGQQFQTQDCTRLKFSMWYVPYLHAIAALSPTTAKDDGELIIFFWDFLSQTKMLDKFPLWADGGVEWRVRGSSQLYFVWHSIHTSLLIWEKK